jgi:arylsulfatase A-like enzyme
MDPMVKTKEIFSGGGMTATHWNIHTPICAPSRAELMSGRYYQNVMNTVETPTEELCGSGAAGQVDLKGKVYPNIFVRELREKKGYNTALFGKCMNGNCHNPPEMQGAFDRWFEGTGFQDSTFWDSETPGNNWKNDTYGGGYGTSQIGNKTVDWIRSLQQEGEGRPFFIYFAPHAPHSPATPSEWYKNAPECDIQSPRTPSFNHSTPEFHNLVSRQPPFNDDDVKGIDKLAKKRCRSLLSVDDTYAEIHAAVAELGLLDNTYFLISSDHGYNLGHHRLPSNKFLLYDHSLRIPMIFKGPGIAANSTTDFLGTQVDLAPTILGLAGIEASDGVDGRSVVPLLVSDTKKAPASVQRHLNKAETPQRTSSFVQYYNQGPWEVGQRHALDDWSNTYIGVTFRDGNRHLKYAEYDPYGKQSGFTSVYFYELFDLEKDPYELHNIYNESSQATKDMLHAITRKWYECQGKSCEGIDVAVSTALV